MLAVQAYLRAKSLHELEEEYGIEAVRHPSLPLLILNYGLKTPNSLKTHPIVRECRSLVLEDGSWDVVARSFPRFFNQGELGDEEFDWSDYTAVEKVDGSLILLFQYGGNWLVTTKRSWAQGPVSGFAMGRPETDMTWEGLFRSCLKPLPHSLHEYLNPHVCYVFELVSPFTQVVRYYEEPAAYLLAAFARNGAEMNEFYLEGVAEALGVRLPETYDIADDVALCKFRERMSDLDPTFEGLVLRDKDGRRLKFKTASYQRLHRFLNNGAVNTPRGLLPVVLGQSEHVLDHFPHLLPAYFDLVESIHGPHGRMLAVWDRAKGLQEQKAFALFVTRHCPRLSSVLFQARKNGEDPEDTFRGSVQFAERLLNS